MTAIAYRDGVMAADTGVWEGYMANYHVRKIGRIQGMLVAASGPRHLIVRFHEWMAGDREQPFDRSEQGEDGFNGLVVMPSGVVLRMDSAGPLMQVEAKFHAIGSACEMLIAAMAANATAKMAVEIAINYSSYAIGGIQVEKLHNDELVEKIVGAPFPAAA